MDKSSLAAAFLATTLWIGLAVMAINGGSVLEGRAWTSRQASGHRLPVRVAPSVAVLGNVHLVGANQD